MFGRRKRETRPRIENAMLGDLQENLDYLVGDPPDLALAKIRSFSYEDHVPREVRRQGVICALKEVYHERLEEAKEELHDVQVRHEQELNDLRDQHFRELNAARQEVSGMEYRYWMNHE